MRSSWMRLSLVALVGIVYLPLTVARVAVWRHETALWEAAAREAPAKPRPWINLGQQLQREGHTARAEAAYATAQRAADNPRRPAFERRLGTAFAEANLASLLVQEGRVNEGWWLIQRTLVRSPDLQDVQQVYAWIDGRR